LAKWGNHFSQLLNIAGVKDVRQTEIHTAEPLVPKPSAFEVELATDKLKSHISSGTDQIPVELMKAGSRIMRYEIQQFIISIWSKEALPEEWKESIIVCTYKKCDKTDCSNYRCKSLLPTKYKSSSNILLSRLIPHAEEIIGDHQQEFSCNRSATDHIPNKIFDTILKSYLP
jgi:sorting nexin-29